MRVKQAQHNIPYYDTHGRTHGAQKANKIPLFYLINLLYTMFVYLFLLCFLFIERSHIYTMYIHDMVYTTTQTKNAHMCPFGRKQD